MLRYINIVFRSRFIIKISKITSMLKVQLNNPFFHMKQKSEQFLEATILFTCNFAEQLLFIEPFSRTPFNFISTITYFLLNSCSPFFLSSRCRVDFQKSPTKNCRIDLDVLGKYFFFFFSAIACHFVAANTVQQRKNHTK